MTTKNREGIVLAGGHSRRFGDRDKALARLDGEPLLKRVVERLSTAVDKIVVSCRDQQQPAFERVLDGSPVSVTYVPDPVPGEGPLAGVNAALEAVMTTYVAVVAVDVPAVDPQFVATLFERAAGSDGAVPRLHDGTPQPTVAVYRTKALSQVSTALLDSGVRSFRVALDELDVRYLDSSEVEERTGWQTLTNVNTPAELAALERDLRRGKQ